MCESTLHIQNNTLLQINAYDPTRTTVLRNTMVRDSNRRFVELIKVIKQTIVDEDYFELKPLQVSAEPLNPLEKGFLFSTDPEKIKAFNKWLQEQIEKGLLEVGHFSQIGESVYKGWTDKYIVEAYKRGIARARLEMIKAGFNVPTIEQTGGIGFSLQVPIHIETLGLLYIRVFEELKGITAQMSQLISRVLAQGIAAGINPIRLAKQLVAVIDGAGIGTLGLTDTLGRFIPAKRRAEILARTEIIRAHHLATINEYRNWGVAGVKVKAEFTTAGDDRVCVICAGLEGTQYTLDDAIAVIPVHPQCRCIMLPVIIKTKKK